MPDCGWIKTVPPDWVSIVAQHGPTVVNVWQTTYSAWSHVQQSDLVLLKRRGSVEDIIGFGTVYCRMPAFTSTAWQRYRFGNGALDEGDLQAKVARRRTSAPVLDPVIGNIIITDLTLFADRPFKLFKESEIRDDHRPQTAISAEVCGRLLLQLTQHAKVSGFDEAGAPMRGAAVSAPFINPLLNAWEDGVRSAYRSCCAVTKIRSRTLLRAVPIRPFDLGGPVSISNGLYLDLNLARLYETKQIAFHLNGVLLVSPHLAVEDPELYRDIAGKVLKLPKRPDEQPALELVQWRFDNHFDR